MIAEPAARRAARPSRRVVLLGAAGRNIHNFNVVYREDPEAKVVAFTAAQIAGIAGRRYPAALAGPLARTEERESLAEFGADYERYMRDVPGFVPRLGDLTGGPRGGRTRPTAKP